MGYSVMARDRSIFVCQQCGYRTIKWLGKCPDCGTWNSFAEERVKGRGVRDEVATAATSPVRLPEIKVETGFRVSTNISELDRVLGGGVVPGGLILIGGDPGIGKSTLLLQALAGIVESSGSSGLYVSAEESLSQVKLRAERLGIDSSHILLLSETTIEDILRVIEDTKPGMVVIDSIQTIYCRELSSAPGTVGQVRECSARLMECAKGRNIPIFIIGHVTKEGSLAGPRVLEHIVDTVLYFEGDRSMAFRILRAVKNRFGSTNEIGIFEMTDRGLREVRNPSEIFLRQRQVSVPGTVTASTIEGTRPFLVEIQALVTPTTFGVPRRTSIGVDPQRVNLLIAVLEKIGGIQFGIADVYINVVGGLRLVETAVDLPVVVALVSSFREMAVDYSTLFFGEIGLSGEVRTVAQPEIRLKEAEKTGMKRVVLPEGNRERVEGRTGMEVIGVKSLTELLEVVFNG